MQHSRVLKYLLDIERDLQIIGEAVNKLSQLNPKINITSATNIIGLRNIIVHAYDSVEYEEPTISLHYFSFNYDCFDFGIHVDHASKRHSQKTLRSVFYSANLINQATISQSEKISVPHDLKT